MYQFENFPIIGKKIDENPEQIVVSGNELIPILIDGVTKHIKLSNLIVNAESGNDGDPGDKGWSPVIGIFTASDKKVFKIVNWVGGQGAKPAFGQYIGSNGLVSNVAEAVQIDFNLSNKADLVGGKVPSSQLPSYVDDVLEFSDLTSFPIVGESGKIYVALDTNLQYRYSGSSYIAYSGGASLPTGGSTGFALVKKSEADNDAEWVDIGLLQNRLISGGETTYTGTTLTVQPAQWEINGIAKQKTTITEFTGVNLSAADKQRWALIYGTVNNTILKLEGDEEDIGVAIKPDLPADTVLIKEVLISDDVVEFEEPDLSNFATKAAVNNERDFIARSTGTGTAYIARHPFEFNRLIRNSDEIRLRVHTPNTSETFTLKLEIRKGRTLNYTLPVYDKNGLSIPAGVFKGDVIVRYVGDQSPRHWRVINIDVSKLSDADIYNGLDQTSPGKALDARQGKILNDTISAAETDQITLKIFKISNYGTL